MHSKEISWLLKEKYNNVLTDEARIDIVRLQEGKPVDYLIGFTDFLGCRIDLSKKPLIPRSETEFWTEKAIQEMRGNPKCLDIFAGSGCIGIGILTHVPGATVDFADSNPEMTEQIEINCKLNDINPSRYRIIQSDIFANLSGSYDYIFANPPYIAENSPYVQESVVQYEPRSALFSGLDGLFHIRRFLKEVKNHLNPGGKFYMEFDSEQKNVIAREFKVEFHKDQFGKWRFISSPTQAISHGG